MNAYEEERIEKEAQLNDEKVRLMRREVDYLERIADSLDEIASYQKRKTEALESISRAVWK